jgi:hypothetical protein
VDLTAARAAYTPVRKEEVVILVATTPKPHTADYEDLLSAREEIAGIVAILPKGTMISLPEADNGLTTENGGSSSCSY